MELISAQFLLLLAASLLAYYAAGRFIPKFQWCVLLATSLVYYYLAAGLPAMGFLLLTAGITWASALKMSALSAQAKEERARTKDRDERKAIRAAYQRKQRILLALSLLACFGMLGYLKYWNTILFNLGLEPSTNSLGILLPLGISFYLFQSTGYLIDVYNDRFAPESNFLKHLCFVSWFPQMIQGPINRYAEMAPAMFEARTPDERKMIRGFLLAGYGLMKKVAIASVLAGSVSAALGNITPSVPGVVVVFGILNYAFQMYADFSGGIDIVRGISELYGIEMALNFEQPYFSRSLAEFWRRWHMSLGEWMKSYVFYPLALTKPMQNLGKWAQEHMGRHIGRVLPACIANILVFLLVGVWHGAERHYVAWGLYNGVVIALSDLLSPVFEKLRELTHYDDEFLPVRIFAMLRTFVVVGIGRYFDTIPSVGVGLIALRNTVTNFAPAPVLELFERYGIPEAQHYGIYLRVLIALAIVFAISVAKERGVDVRNRILGWSLPVRICIYLVFFLLIGASFEYITNGGGGFMYANF